MWLGVARAEVREAGTMCAHFGRFTAKVRSTPVEPSPSTAEPVPALFTRIDAEPVDDLADRRPRRAVQTSSAQDGDVGQPVGE
jgi:hypothetical protein